MTCSGHKASRKESGVPCSQSGQPRLPRLPNQAHLPRMQALSSEAAPPHAHRSLCRPGDIHETGIPVQISSPIVTVSPRKRAYKWMHFIKSPLSFLEYYHM